MVLAHAGHWLVQVMYAAPVLVLLALLAWGKLSERRRRGRGPQT
jgi:hypothetical protein